MFRKSLTGTTKPPELEMTPMIDIVFQLLAFFIMTFRITALEGDFNIQMPVQSNTPSLDMPLDTPIVVSLISGDDRNLSSININDTAPLTGTDKIQKLAKYIQDVASQRKDPTSDEELVVEFVIDFDLRYSETVQAITAVVGKKQGKGLPPLKFVDSIKFRDQGARIE